MKSILITTDFSANSKHTIEVVLDFIKDLQGPCRLLLLNTYMVTNTDLNQVIHVNDRLKIQSKLGLDEMKNEALKMIGGKNITVETASHMGTLKNVVSQIIQNENIDLVAMGKRNGRHVENVAGALKKLNCPLLITYYSKKQT